MGWVMDYVVPSTNRYHPDIAGVFPSDIKAGTVTIPGSGNDPFALTSVDDVAKAVVELLKSFTTGKWRHTYQGMGKIV
ncbi:putative oxidoreductase swnR [Phytophthora infestans]|uniref:Putative oxidoreductase swnR n=1 Tax=Phytophthora infestans TaxID=4787 RepID=A0A8S9U5U6_PHYIN|nr:putative oxidoreductase swnR [Phytophthora infestans]